MPDARAGDTDWWLAEGKIVEIFGETATLWSQDDVREFQNVAGKKNETGCDVQKLQFYVSGSNLETQCHLYVVPCEDAELALSMEITSSLQHSLQSQSEWRGVGQSANHICCKRHQNFELQFISVQAMQEDDDGNALTTVKPDVAAVLRAKREIQPGELIRYQCTDQSEHLEKIFERECCLHVGLCQPHGQKSMLERLAANPKQSFPEMRKLKVGALMTIKTAGVAQQWTRGQQHQDCHSTFVKIKFENSEMTVNES